MILGRNRFVVVESIVLFLLFWKKCSSFSYGGIKSERSLNPLRLSEKNFCSDDGDFKESVKAKLSWELLKEQESKPVLNLSIRDASPEDEEETNKIIDEDDWMNGSRWKATKEQLQQMNIISQEKNVDNESYNIDELFLTAAPQLYRLKTNEIMETVSVILNICTEDESKARELIKMEPKLLTYPSIDVEYGMEFLQTMFMLQSSLPQSMITPELMVSGIEGGIQERHVSRMLGDAASATSGANQRIAADAVALRKSINNKSTNKFGS